MRQLAPKKATICLSLSTFTVEVNQVLIYASVLRSLILSTCIGYVYGNPANWPFDDWIHQSPNVVIASVYYRLDSIGFLTAPEFLQDSSLGDVNAGFKDQSMALSWVQSHISSFGGDPSKVTINGESAGGSSIELHLVSHEEHKFSQAIAQSVYRAPLPLPEQQTVRDCGGIRQISRSLTVLTACSTCSTCRTCSTTMLNTLAAALARLKRRWRAFAAWTSALSRARRTWSCTTCGLLIQILPPSSISLAHLDSTGPYASFHPVIDNDLFTEYPTIAIQNGRLADVPVIAG